MVLAASTLALTACGGRTQNQSNESDQRVNPLGFDNGVAPTEPGQGLSGIEALALFGLVPLVLLLAVAALVWLPGMVRGNRYRPAKGWSAAPLWFGGPPDPAAAVETAQTGDLVRGGASGSW